MKTQQNINQEEVTINSKKFYGMTIAFLVTLIGVMIIQHSILCFQQGSNGLMIVIMGISGFLFWFHQKNNTETDLHSVSHTRNFDSKKD